MNLRGEKSHSPTDEEAGERAVGWAIDTGTAPQVKIAMTARVRQIRRRRMGAALGGLACLLVAGLFWRSAEFKRAAASQALSPATASPAFVSFPRTQVLPDGSVVEFRDNSKIALNFTPAFRRVALVSGTAHFRVTKNRQRPFIVTAGGVEVRAVGTAFSVQLGISSVEVLVTEGRVAVDQPSAGGEAFARPSGSSPALPVLLPAGHRVIVDRASFFGSPSVEAVSAAAMAEELSWRVPRLTLSGTSLSDVIPVLNEYGRVHIVLADPALASVQLSGSLRADNTSSFLGILELQFGIKADTKGSAIILHR